MTKGACLLRGLQGKVYIPTLKCNDTAQPCYDKSSDFWYDFPGEDEFEGYTATPSGLEIKDLPVNPDLKDLVLNSPSPDVEEVGHCCCAVRLRISYEPCAAQQHVAGSSAAPGAEGMCLPATARPPRHSWCMRTALLTPHNAAAGHQHHRDLCGGLFDVTTVPDGNGRSYRRILRPRQQKVKVLRRAQPGPTHVSVWQGVHML